MSCFLQNYGVMNAWGVQGPEWRSKKQLAKEQSPGPGPAADLPGAADDKSDEDEILASEDLLRSALYLHDAFIPDTVEQVQAAGPSRGPGGALNEQRVFVCCLRCNLLQWVFGCCLCCNGSLH